jgi:hypothetical protein
VAILGAQATEEQYMKKFGRTGSLFGTLIAAMIILALAGTTGAVAGGLITSKKIKDNTIKSRDVRNGNLTGIDIADGSLGKSDINGAAQGFTTVVTKRVTASDVAIGGDSTRDVFCADGQVAIGGGGYTSPGLVIGGSDPGWLMQSLPIRKGFSPLFITSPAGDNAEPQGWRTQIYNDSGAIRDQYHYAICAGK